MQIYLSTWLEISQKEVLDAKEYRKRLLSYYFLVVSNKSGEDPYLQRGDCDENNS